MNKITAKFEELFGIDIRALAIMRIALCVCILIELSDNLPYIKLLYSDEGLLPRAYATHLLGPNVICLNLMSGSWVFQALLFFLTAIFTVGLLLGWRTRVCTFFVWILLSSFHARNYLILAGGYKLLHVLLFWFLFLPWGACYSLDSRRNIHHPPPLRVSSMGSAAYLLQICFFYTFAGLLKTHPIWTTQGTAIYYVLNIDALDKPFGHVLLQHPLLMQQLTFAVLWLEHWGAFFFFVPFKNAYFRLMTIAAFMLFQIGTLLCMELRLFPWICLIALAGFLPTPFLNKILGDFSQKSDTPPEKHSFFWKPDLFYMPPYLSAIIAFFIVYVFFSNMGELKNPLFKIPPQIRWIGHTFNINQHWGMFAPGPMTYDGWCVMPGKLRNGKIVDVFNSGAPVTWREPDSIQKFDKIFGLTSYYLNISNEKNYYYRKPWAEYVCHEWNTTHPFDQQLLGLDIDFMQENTPPPGHSKPVPRRVLLISHNCFGPNLYPAVSVFKDGELPDDTHQLILYSKTQTIDGIHRSMTGPWDDEPFVFIKDAKPQLLWVTGFKVEVIDPQTKAVQSPEYLCHSHIRFNTRTFDLNKRNPTLAPGLRHDFRLVTLIQGRTEINLPRNFAVPVLSNEPFVFYSMTISNNPINKPLKLQVKGTFSYIKDTELTSPMKPLFRRVLTLRVPLDTHAPPMCLCETGMAENMETVLDSEPGNFSKYHGQNVISHWFIPPGRHLYRYHLGTLQIPFDTTVHYMAMHIHPYGTFCELNDLTALKSVFKILAANYKDRIGIEKSEIYSNSAGIPVFKDHQYEIACEYNNTTSQDIDAMAIIYLYLLNKNFDKNLL